MPIPRRFTNWFVATVLLATGLTYICDSLYIGHKMSSGNSADALGSVQFFPATKLKNGKLDIYIESPQTETCVHALFPHYGYNPCWYAKRNQVHVVAQRIPKTFKTATQSNRYAADNNNSQNRRWQGPGETQAQLKS